MGRDKLFQPINIGKCLIKNRLVMGPMGNINMADPIGRPSNKMISYFQERAKGGTGLLITGLVPVSQGIDATVSEDNDTTYFPRIDGSSRTRLSGWRDLASAVHGYDSKIFVQLTAGLGRVGSPEAFLKGKILKSASINKNFYVTQVPHFSLSDMKIKKIVKSFGQSALNTKVSGIDGIHLHGHEGYLMDQLTSRPWNRRKFGRYSNIFQFAIDVVKEIKSKCGEDYPVIYRIDLTQALRQAYGDDIFKKNFRGMERTLEEGLNFCKELADAGVDAFDVDKGCYDNWFYPHPPAYFDNMVYVEEIAGTLKKYFEKENINKPVIAVGKLGKPEIAEKVLEENFADMVMLGRPLLADPYWPKKVKEDRENEIIHCIGDQEGCIKSFILGGHPCCAINPYTGFEDVKTLTKAEKIKKVAIIGAGPGGCEAAKVLFDRGHDVTLFDENSKIGGQFLLNEPLLIKHDLHRYMKNQEHIMNGYVARGLKLTMNTKVAAEDIENNFDTIIIATGVKETIPKISGLNNIPHIGIRELLKSNFKLPDNTKKVTIIGGGATGCEVAYSLAHQKGMDVTVIEMLPELMNGMVHANRSMLLWLMSGMGSPTDKVEDRLKNPIKAFTASKVIRFESDQVVLEANRARWNPYTPWNTLVPENIHNPFAKKLNKDNIDVLKIDTDYVIFASGVKSENELYLNLLKDCKCKEVYCVGDSRSVSSAWEAINDANELARSI